MESEQRPTDREPAGIVTEIAELRQIIAEVRGQGRTIGVVPTMGALHEGHLSLVRRSVRDTDFTIVTIFVNPAQFGPGEDFSRYPRTLDADVEKLGRESADLLFVPSTDQMYPPGFSTYVQPPAVATPLEGRCRAGFFRGVATVVLKLFHLIPADVAFFGQKDYQQSRVIQDMVRDLNLPIRIDVCPIIRESDGLAMSSRNQYLSEAERRQSLAIVRSLRRACELAQQGQRDATAMLGEMRSVLETAGISRIEYVALVHPQTLDDVRQVTDDTMALVAAYVGDTRLIDNCRIG
jgi:pantoate--beta-alanine ligase